MHKKNPAHVDVPGLLTNTGEARSGLKPEYRIQLQLNNKRVNGRLSLQYRSRFIDGHVKPTSAK